MNVAQAAQAALQTANSVAAKVRSLEAMIKARGEESVRRFDRLDSLLVGKRPMTHELILAGAEKIIPFTYNIDIALTVGSTARQGGIATINQDGYFLLDRIYFSYRMTAGGDAGTFRPISSGSASFVQAITSEIDFLWEISDGTAQRLRQENPTPGDIVFRQDDDGKYVTPDVYPPASTVNVFVTPLTAPAAANVMTCSLQGRQCLNTLKDSIR